MEQEQIKKWKEEHKEVFRITSEDGKECYLKYPSRKAMGYAGAVAGSNPVRSSEILLNDMWLGGDEAFKNDDRLFFGLSLKLNEITQAASVELEKL
jgi:hypothetical protein